MRSGYKCNQMGVIGLGATLYAEPGHHPNQLTQMPEYCPKCHADKRWLEVRGVEIHHPASRAGCGYTGYIAVEAPQAAPKPPRVPKFRRVKDAHHTCQPHCDPVVEYWKRGFPTRWIGAKVGISHQLAEYILRRHALWRGRRRGRPNGAA